MIRPQGPNGVHGPRPRRILRRMGAAPANPISFRTLYASPLVAVREYRCAACAGGPGPEEFSAGDTVVLMRHGAFCRHFGRRRVTADANQVAFFPRGSTYRVSHPASHGDHGTSIALSPRILGELLEAFDPRFGDDEAATFPFDVGPCAPGLFRRHADVVRQLAFEREPLAADVLSLQLAADALAAAFDHAVRPVGSASRRRGTHDDHADLVERTKAHFSAHLEGRITLEDLARAVHASPFHLARVFQQHTGTPLHRYFTALRLRAAATRLVEGERDMSALALRYGFASHSHFTGAFRREFGVPPSAFRRTQTSKI